MKDITLVIPTMNEEEGIRECIERGRKAFNQLGMEGEVLVVDSSTDRTPDIAKEMGARVVEPEQKGYGNAYMFGFDHADGKLIAMGDGDTTYDFEELPKLVEKVQDGADMAMGSRLNGDIKEGAMPALHQYIGNPLLTRFLNVFYDAGVSDAHSGMRVIRKEAIEDMNLSSPGMEFASEMVMKAAASDKKIEEEPITYHEREGEATLSSFKDGWRHVKFMIANAPDKTFTIPGVPLLFIGFLSLILSFAGFKIGKVELSAGTAITGTMMSYLGFQLVSLAFFSTYSTETVKNEGKMVKWLKQRFTVERGLAFGAIVAGTGIVFAAVLILKWIQTGFEVVPSAEKGLSAATLIILGLETMSNSFFVEMIDEEA